MSPDPSLPLSTLVALVGVVSGLLGAVGAGVGVYVSMRLETAAVRAAYQLAISELRGEVFKWGAAVDVRLQGLERDMRSVGEFARRHTRPGDLSER